MNTRKKPATGLSLLLFLLLLLILTTFVSGCILDSGNDTASEVSGEETPFEEERELRDAEEADFKALMRNANSYYVKALISTSKKDYPASEKALAALIGVLNSVETRYVENPPAPYAGDEAWPETLAQALNITKASQTYLQENDIDSAHEALEPMRDLFLDLHQRNDIDLMGDRLTRFHTVMEHAVEAAGKNDTTGVGMLVPELEFLWGSVEAAEPPENADEAYEASLEAVELKIHELEIAVILNDAEETKKVAEELKGAFAKMFGKYGVVIA